MTSLFHSILSQLQEKISIETTAKDDIAAIVSEVLRTTVVADQIELHKKVLRIKVAPTLKMALRLCEKKLLKTLQKKGFDIIGIQ